MDGSFESRLIMAKSRLAPLKKITTVRLELNAALLLARIKEFIQREIRYNFVNIVIVDSEIVRAMTQKDSYGFNTLLQSGLVKSKRKLQRMNGIGLRVSSILQTLYPEEPKQEI